MRSKVSRQYTVKQEVIRHFMTESISGEEVRRSSEVLKYSSLTCTSSIKNKTTYFDFKLDCQTNSQIKPLNKFLIDLIYIYCYFVLVLQVLKRSITVSKRHLMDQLTCR